MKEEVTRLNVFGKHPGYRKKPMSVPANVEVAPNDARDWNDDSAKGEEPFGRQIGSSAPYNEKVVNILTDMVSNAIRDILREDVDEKTFLRLPQEEQPAPAPVSMPGPNAMMGMMDPNMGGDPNAMGGDPSMGGDPNAMGGGPGTDGADPNAMGDEQFGADFDAGVEADEDTDPENYIQQLTGKLAQSLRDYDEQNPGKLDLDKYVLGMIVKQAVKGMDEGERKKVIKKIKETPLPSDDQMEDTSTEGVEPDPALDGGEDQQQAPDMGGQQEEQPMNEIRSMRMSKKQAKMLMESLNDRNDDAEEDRRDVKYSKYVKPNKRTYPFIPPQFK